MNSEIRDNSIVLKSPISPKLRAFFGIITIIAGCCFLLISSAGMDDTLIFHVFLGPVLIIAGFGFFYKGFKDVHSGRKFDEWIIDLEEGSFTASDGKTLDLAKIQCAEMGGNNAFANVSLKMNDDEYNQEIAGFATAPNHDCQLLWVALNTVKGVEVDDSLTDAASELGKDINALLKAMKKSKEIEKSKDKEI